MTGRAFSRLSWLVASALLSMGLPSLGYSQKVPKPRDFIADNLPGGATQGVPSGVEDITSFSGVRATGGLLPQGTIQIRNGTTQVLIFYVRVSQSNASWKPFYIRPGANVFPRANLLTVAIATNDKGAPEISLAELRTLASISEEGDQSGRLFARRLRERKRFDLCWSSSNARWVIQDCK